MSEEQAQPVGELTHKSEEILDYLKMLNYETEFLKKSGLKQINRVYFAEAQNTNEQFQCFIQLVQWLLSLNDHSTEFNKYDDPMTICTQIVQEAKKLNVDCQFAPIKLKAGYGENVIYVLLHLLKTTFKRKVKVQKCVINQNKAKQEEPEVIDDGDPNLDLAENIEDSEDEFMEEDILNNYDGQIDLNEENQVITSKVDQKDWILECERVVTKLKYGAAQAQGSREWRQHIEQTKGYSDTIKKIMPVTRQSLERLSDELEKVLDVISKRENNINMNMSNMGGEYKQLSQDSNYYSQKYQTLTGNIREMGEKYKALTDKYDQLQSKTNEQGTQVTDSSPIVKIKSSLQKIRGDIKDMDVRIGVLNHSIISHKLKNKDTDDIGFGIEEMDELEEN